MVCARSLVATQARGGSAVAAQALHAAMRPVDRASLVDTSITRSASGRVVVDPSGGGLPGAMPTLGSSPSQAKLDDRAAAERASAAMAAITRLLPPPPSERLEVSGYCCWGTGSECAPAFSCHCGT